jgi:RNA polymerase sigma factor (sigma-70 family)
VGVMAARAFEATVLPHLDAAFNFARWLTRNDAEAEDVVQDACVRALRYFPSRRDGDPRAWFFAIVRNAWYSRIARRSGSRGTRSIDDTRIEPLDQGPDPETQLLSKDTVVRVRGAIEQLPVEFREVLVLREIEGLSYREIATVVRVPIGTVMSRLARARERLQSTLTPADPMESLP